MAKKNSSKNGSGLIRVLVAASSAIRRSGLEAALKAAPRIKLVGSTPALGSFSGQVSSAQFSPAQLSRTQVSSTQASSTQAVSSRTGSAQAISAGRSARVVSNPAVLAPAFLEHVRALDPDVLLLDLDRAGQFFDPSQLFARLPFPEAAAPAIVTLVDAPSPAFTAHALRSEVKSILPRDAPADEIVSAIHAAHAGLVLLDPAVAQDLAHHAHAKARHVHADATRLHAEATAEANDEASVEAVVEANDDEAFDDLTARETEILRMLSEGLANKQIAVALGISEHTVKFHISSILDKLGASTRTEAVTSAIRMGLIFV